MTSNKTLHTPQVFGPSDIVCQRVRVVVERKPDRIVCRHLVIVVISGPPPGLAARHRQLAVDERSHRVRPDLAAPVDEVSVDPTCGLIDLIKDNATIILSLRVQFIAYSQTSGKK